MRHRLTDERRGFAARLAIAAAGLLVAIGGYVGAGFVLFLGSMAPLPAKVAVRVRGPEARRRE